MKEFKYNVVSLIQCVRDRPCLWDKTLESYKDRIERRSAWEEIFNILDEHYEDMLPEEKRIMGELVLNKWTNIRDTFVKTLRSKMGRPKRKYMLHEHLKFLTKITTEDLQAYSVEDTTSYPRVEDTTPYAKVENLIDYVESTYQDTNSQSTSDQDAGHGKKSKRTDLTDDSTAHTSSNEDYSHRRRSKRNKPNPRISDSGNDLDFLEIGETSDARIMNEDEAFFASLLPTVVKYNEDERLEFRIEVLAVMKRIKNNRQWQRDN